MPVEVKELVIRTVVSHEQDTAGRSTTPSSSPASVSNQQLLIQKCVDEVLKILKKTEKR